MLDICRVPISEHSVGEEDGSENIVKVDHFMVLSPKDDVTEPSGITKSDEGEWTGDAAYEEEKGAGRGSMIFEVMD